MSETTQGRPIAEAPRDGSVILVETMNSAGTPSTGGYAFELMKFDKGLFSSWIPADQEPEPADGSFRAGVFMSYGNSAILQWWPGDTDPATLTLTPRTNFKWQPSNGTEGAIFQDQFCEHCKADKPYRDSEGMKPGCDILARSLLFDIGDDDYPEEWTDRDGKPRCTAFEQE
jgi:hypothetical protein